MQESPVRAVVVPPAVGANLSALEPGTRTFRLATVEDTVLRKLERYRAGGETSDRQWHDILGMLRLRGPSLDRGYLEQWAPRLGVDDLLMRAVREASAG